MNRAHHLLLVTAILGLTMQQDSVPLDRMAEHIVHALEPVPDERIALRFNPSTLPALEPVVRAALARSGARVETWQGPSVDDFERRLAATDVYIWLPGASAITSAEQSAALRRWVDAGGTRREIHFHWSEGTLNADTTPGQHSALFDRMYVRALEIDYAALRSSQDAAIAILGSGEVRVTTPAGTDLRFRTGDRPFNRQDGDGSRRRVARARMRIDRHIELPAGIVRVAPLEESVRGTIVIPSINRGGQRMDGVRLQIDAGKVTIATAKTGQQALDEMLKNSPALASFREFGLGFNPALTQAAGSNPIAYYGYGDGTVRLSLGDNEELGGSVRGGAVLWNFFPDATVTVNDRVLVANGRSSRSSDLR
jgi:aminopeptidase